MKTLIKNQGPFLSLTLAMICIQFDSFSVSLALDSLTTHWSLSYKKSQWVISVYLMGVGLSMLPTGIACDVFDHRKVLLIGLTLFSASTFACGLARDFYELILGRAFQGISAGMVIPSGIAYLTLYYSDFRKKIAMVMGLGYVAMSLGPIIGSYLINEYTWRSLLIGCVPIMLAAVFLIILSSSSNRLFNQDLKLLKTRSGIDFFH